MVYINNTKRPYLSIASIILVFISLLIKKVLGNMFGPEADLLGYTVSGMTFLVLIVLFFLGFILGLVSIYRREQPKLLPFLAVISNGAALFWLLWLLLNMPS